MDYRAASRKNAADPSNKQASTESDLALIRQRPGSREAFLAQRRLDRELGQTSAKIEERPWTNSIIRERLAQWRDHGLSTEETDVELVKSVIGQIYQSLGQERPEYFFCDSPYAYFSEIGQRRVQGIAFDDSIQSRLKYDWEAVQDGLFRALRNGLCTELSGQLESHWNKIWGDFGSKLGFELCVHARSEMRERVNDFDSDPAWNLLWGKTFRNLQQSFTGSMSCYWPALYLTAGDLGVIYEKKDQAILHTWAALAQSCFFWYPFRSVCFVSRRPARFYFDKQGKANGVLFTDGLSLRWPSPSSL